MNPEVPCDVMIARGGRVFINGNEIGRVISLNVDQELNRPSRMTLELAPTSLVAGEPPESTVRHMLGDDGLSDPDARVDINKAIERAKARVAKKVKEKQGVDDGDTAD